MQTADEVTADVAAFETDTPEDLWVDLHAESLIDTRALHF
jgi:hypothetical protein